MVIRASTNRGAGLQCSSQAAVLQYCPLGSLYSLYSRPHHSLTQYHQVMLKADVEASFSGGGSASGLLLCVAAADGETLTRSVTKQRPRCCPQSSSYRKALPQVLPPHTARCRCLCSSASSPSKGRCRYPPYQLQRGPHEVQQQSCYTTLTHPTSIAAQQLCPQL